MNGPTGQSLAVQRPVQIDRVLLDMELGELELSNRWAQTLRAPLKFAAHDAVA